MNNIITADFLMEALSFDDVLIQPTFSTIESRKEIKTNVALSNTLELDVPILSANMDTVTGPKMAKAMSDAGGVGCLHRFSDIEQNAKDFIKSPTKTFVSIGVGEKEYERALYLHEHGARNFIIDVAHGAALHVVKQYDALRSAFGRNVYIMVGNFATAKSINVFCDLTKSKIKPDSFKIGIGSGSLCTTRIVTGCGLPTLASILDCRTTGRTLIADGGIKNSGDIVKALAAGASAVMIGGLLSGTDETPGETVDGGYKVYRGSASEESYKAQNKQASHRTPEGERTLVKSKGSARDVVNNLVAGLKSGMSYVNASNLSELKEKAKFYKITNSGARESHAHGKTI